MFEAIEVGCFAIAGYSGAPLWKKLGYKTQMSAYIDGGPSNYRSLLALPADVGVTWLPRAKSDMEFVHLFATSNSKLKRKLEYYRERIVPGGVIWGLLAEEEFRGEE